MSTLDEKHYEVYEQHCKEVDFLYICVEMDEYIRSIMQRENTIENQILIHENSSQFLQDRKINLWDKKSLSDIDKKLIRDNLDYFHNIIDKN